MPATEVSAPTDGGQRPGIRRWVEFEVDRRVLLLGVALGALAGLAVVVMMTLLTGHA